MEKGKLSFCLTNRSIKVLLLRGSSPMRPSKCWKLVLLTVRKIILSSILQKLHVTTVKIVPPSSKGVTLVVLFSLDGRRLLWKIGSLSSGYYVFSSLRGLSPPSHVTLQHQCSDNTYT